MLRLLPRILAIVGVCFLVAPFLFLTVNGVNFLGVFLLALAWWRANRLVVDGE